MFSPLEKTGGNAPPAFWDAADLNLTRAALMQVC